MSNSTTYRLLVLIATQKLCDKAAELFLGASLPVQFRLNAEGTASSEILDTLGLGSIDKGILLCTVPKAHGEMLLTLLHKQLRLDAVNSGIAFTVPLTGVTSLLFKMMNSAAEKSGIPEGGKENSNMDKNDYALVCAVVDRGFGGDVMKAARGAGAGGGTILHGRGLDNPEASAFWGLSVKEEKELVLILADHDDKVKIMSAVSEKFGMQSKAKGLVLSLPVDSVIGV